MIEHRSWFSRVLAAARIAAWKIRCAHPERFCHRCGGRNVSWFAPSPLWNAVMREGSIAGPWRWHEIICPLCFVELGEQQDIGRGWRLDAKEVLVPLETVTPSGRIWDESKGLWGNKSGGPT